MWLYSSSVFLMKRVFVSEFIFLPWWNKGYYNNCFFISQDDEEEGGSDSGRDADILQRLTNVHQEFMKKSNDYDEIHNDFVQSEQVSQVLRDIVSRKVLRDIMSRNQYSDI